MIRRAAQEDIAVCRDIIWDSELFRTWHAPDCGGQPAFALRGGGTVPVA